MEINVLRENICSQYNKENVLRTSHYHRSEKYRKEIHDLIPGGPHLFKGDDNSPISTAAAAWVRGLFGMLTIINFDCSTDNIMVRVMLMSRY
jgi:hypothetical protein